MQWKCPQCGIEREDISSECSCGYSAYKILGIKPEASAEEAKQAYKYLLTVWQADGSSHDPASKKKAEERLKKINGAYEIFKKNLPDSSVDTKKNSYTKIAASAGVVFIILLGVLAFTTNVFKSDNTVAPGATQNNDKTVLPTLPEKSEKTVIPSGTTANESAQPSVQSDMDGEITEEKALEMVKKSQAIYRNTPTEAIIKKWTEDNSSKYEMVGWQVRKMDDERYLVSYTAKDGNLTKGFYFDLDIRTRKVENLANKPELQKKYNVQYSQ